MPTKPEKNLFEYAVVRYVPDIEREEFVNIGLVMMCKRKKWLRCRFSLNKDKISALAPEADSSLLEFQIDSFRKIAAGDRSPIGELEAHERFRWLTAVRSACIATSRPHPGFCSDLDSTFEELFNRLV